MDFWRAIVQRLPGSWAVQPGHGLALGHIAYADLPACNHSRNGEKRRVAGAAGTADREVMCEKDAANAYAWQDHGTAYFAATYGTTTPADNVFRVVGSSDATKKLAFEVDGFTTATTRTLTPPNFDGTIATLAGTETFTNKTLTAPIFSAGSASAASWPKMTSGTVMTTAEAGAVEYDGKSFYAGSIASHRGLVLAPHTLVQATDYTGANSNAAQKIFNTSTNGLITLPASTTYLFDCVIHIHTTGTTSHSFSVGFAGTATYFFFGLQALYNPAPPATEVGSGVSTFWMTSGAPIAFGGAAAAATHHTLSFRGSIRVDQAGTLIPQYTWSAAPGVAGITLAGSYITLAPVGSNAIGNWS